MGGEGGQKSAKKCHVLFEWPLTTFLRLGNVGGTNARRPGKFVN